MLLELTARLGRVAAELRGKPDSVQVVDNPWHDPRQDSDEMYALRVNANGLVVRGLAMSVSGKPPSLQAAIDEASARHVSEEAILAEWIASEPDSDSVAAELVMRLARSLGQPPDQSWQGPPPLTIYTYRPRADRWGNVVSYDSGRSTDEGLDWTRAFESVDEARAAFEKIVRR